MNQSTKQLTLASASPRRREMLTALGFEFDVIPADINESRKMGEPAADFVVRLACEKAQLVSAGSSLPVLAADTIVCDRSDDNGICFGKPVDKTDAFAIWRSLSGSEHQVLTALALVVNDKQQDKEYKKLRAEVPRKIYSKLSISTVKFSVIPDKQMEVYWRSGEPQDKAGAYGIQGLAAAWVESIQGSHSGIVGLPLFELNHLLQKVGLNWL